MIKVGRVCAACGEFFETSCPTHPTAMQYVETRYTPPPPNPRRAWVPPIRKRITWGDR